MYALIKVWHLFISGSVTLRQDCSPGSLFEPHQFGIWSFVNCYQRDCKVHKDLISLYRSADEKSHMCSVGFCAIGSALRYAGEKEHTQIAK